MDTVRRLSVALTAVVVAGCSGHQATPAASTVTKTVKPADPSTPALAPSASNRPAPSQTPATPSALGPCSDDDLAVTNGPLESADTLRHVIVSFTNTASRACTLVGYPGADLVTPAGGLLINIPRRPANAAHRLMLNPGDTATAEVQAYAVDTATGETCARWGNVVVTPPNDFVAHPLSVDLPICDATISSVD